MKAMPEHTRETIADTYRAVGAEVRKEVPLVLRSTGDSAIDRIILRALLDSPQVQCRDLVRQVLDLEEALYQTSSDGAAVPAGTQQLLTYISSLRARMATVKRAVGDAEEAIRAVIANISLNAPSREFTGHGRWLKHMVPALGEHEPRVHHAVFDPHSYVRQSLSDEQQTLLVALYQNGTSQQNIANILGISQSTVSQKKDALIQHLIHSVLPLVLELERRTSGPHT